MHTIFVITMYVLINQVSAQIKYVLSSHQICIRNAVAQIIMKWKIYVFDIVEPTNVCNPTAAFNILCIPYVI